MLRGSRQRIRRVAFPAPSGPEQEQFFTLLEKFTRFARCFSASLLKFPHWLGFCCYDTKRYCMIEIFISITIALLVIFTVASFMARPILIPPTVRASQMTEVWKSTLALSDDQAAKVLQLMLAYEREREVINTRPISESIFELRRLRRNQRVRRREYHRRLREILLPEQRKLARTLLIEMWHVGTKHHTHLAKHLPSHSHPAA